MSPKMGVTVDAMILAARVRSKISEARAIRSALDDEGAAAIFRHEAAHWRVQPMWARCLVPRSRGVLYSKLRKDTLWRHS